jgi:thioredoxin reductase
MQEHPTGSPDHDVIIIGGGSAGLSAALMLGRARRRVLVIDGGTPRNRFAAHMHGVLGNDGTPPLTLLDQGRKELEQYPVTVTTGTVSTVTDIPHGLQVTREDGTVDRARSLLIASGLEDDLPDIPGLAEHWGGAVFQCPYCHGWEVRDQRIGVIASSPTVIHLATLIRQWTDELTVFTTDPTILDGIDRTARARLDARGVRFIGSPVTGALSADGGFAGLQTADGRVHGLDAVAVSPASRPRDHFLDALALDRTEFPGVGSFLTVDPAGRTGHPRIWAAGNVVNPQLNVPASIGQAALTAGALNFALVEEDTDLAVAGRG